MSLISDLRNISAFSGLINKQLEQIGPFLNPCSFTVGETIFRQGEAAEMLYILNKGKVKIIFKPYDGPPLTVTRIAPGGVFGWSAALGRDVYTSAAVSVSESAAYYILGEQIESIYELNDDTGIIFIERLTGIMEERNRSTHREILNIISQSTDGGNKDQ